MAEERIGIIRAIFRYFRFWNWKKARGIIKAADKQFTGSVDGINAAFDIHQDKLVSQYRDLRMAVSEVEAILEDKRARLEDLNREEEDLIGKRDGALTLAEKAQAEGDDKAYDQHARAFERFQARIEEIEATQSRLEEEVKETGTTMERYMAKLTDMQAEIQKLPQQKAGAIAEFVSAKRIVELNDRLQGLESSIDRGPISAVLSANRKLTAKARISEKLAGSDVRIQDKAYESAGRTSTARSKMEEMLAARKAERAAAKEPAPQEQTKEERPEI